MNKLLRAIGYIIFFIAGSFAALIPVAFVSNRISADNLASGFIYSIIYFIFLIFGGLVFYLALSNWLNRKTLISVWSVLAFLIILLALITLPFCESFTQC